MQMKGQEHADYDVMARVAPICDCDERGQECDCEYELDHCVVWATDAASARSIARRIFNASRLTTLADILSVERR